MSPNIELPGDRVNVIYVNHRGEEEVRHIIPQRLFFGTSDFYPTPQYLLDCFDLDKMAPRTYRMGDIKAWGV